MTSAWRARIAALLLVALPLQALATLSPLLCPHHQAAAATAIDAPPPCHGDMAADDADLIDAADAATDSACTACGLCTASAALPSAMPRLPVQLQVPAPADAMATRHADAEIHALERPPRA